MTRALDEDEESLATLLARCGLPSAAARVAVALLRGPPLAAAQIAEATGLTSQAVSLAARDLEAAEIAARESRPTTGRGRPPLVLRLADPSAILRYEQARRAILLAELAQLDTLRIFLDP